MQHASELLLAHVKQDMSGQGAKDHAAPPGQHGLR